MNDPTGSETTGESTKEVRFPLRDGRVVIVKIRYSANTVIVVPVPPRPKSDDYSWSIQSAGEDFSIVTEADIVRPAQG